MPPGFFFQGWKNDEQKDAYNEQQVKNNRCRPVDLLAEETPEVAGIKPLGDESQPGQINDQENDGGEEVTQDEFAEWHGLFFCGLRI